MRHFLEALGAPGKYLPCLAVVAILLTWHLLRRDPWQLQPLTTAGMCLESALLALPVLTMGNLLGYYLPLAGGPDSRMSGYVLAIGAGIYEELVFRLIAFNVMSFALTDLLKVRTRIACPLIVLSSAILFSAYHHWSPDAGCSILATSYSEHAQACISEHCSNAWIWRNRRNTHSLRSVLFLPALCDRTMRTFFSTLSNAHSYNAAQLIYPAVEAAAWGRPGFPRVTKVGRDQGLT